MSVVDGEHVFGFTGGVIDGAVHPAPDTPLVDVTFCVLDLETTGGAPQTDAITEIGAVLVRGGETLGTFQTFVHPGTALPSRVSWLTGITECMVADAPRPEAVLPTFLEFLRGAVIVGHNVRFDLGFLNAALARAGYPRLAAPVVDTCVLARRLVREDVPDCRLDTLARWLRLDHHPSHRALADALATTDLLHTLLERSAAYGTFRLDDLLALPSLAGHPYADKLRLTDPLPRTPGVYEFVDRAGVVMYVGKATNLRARVRSYFGSDDRRLVRPLLSTVHHIRHRPMPHPLVAEVAELRLLHAQRPRFNRAGALPRSPAWLRLTDDAFPRLTAVTRPAPYTDALGPFPNLGAARRAQEAIETVVPVRRCGERPRSTVPLRLEPCPDALLGVTVCPCSGSISPQRYAELVAATRRVLLTDPAAAASALRDRMTALGTALRFEEAALARDRLNALLTAHRTRAAHAAFLAAGRFDLVVDDAVLEIDTGRLVGLGGDRRVELPPMVEVADPAVLGPAQAAESAVLARWLLRYPDRWQAPGRDELLDALAAARQLTVAPSESMASS